MRIFGLVGLVLALLFVGVLTKKQLPVATEKGQPTTQQLMQQIKQSVETGEQPHALPDSQ